MWYGQRCLVAPRGLAPRGLACPSRGNQTSNIPSRAPRGLAASEDSLPLPARAAALPRRPSAARDRLAPGHHRLRSPSLATTPGIRSTPNGPAGRFSSLRRRRRARARSSPAPDHPPRAVRAPGGCVAEARPRVYCRAARLPVASESRRGVGTRLCEGPTGSRPLALKGGAPGPRPRVTSLRTARAATT